MGQISSYLIGGLAAVASWTMVAPGDHGRTPASPSAMLRSPAAAHIAGANRTAKGDRLAPARPADQRTVAAIEVVGVNDAAIIYRDRNGNLLYRTDPVNNVTIIAKGVRLPDVTVRRTVGSSTIPVPIRVPEKTKLPVGCEPAASPIASPQLSHLTGRCISRLATTAVASID